MGKAYFDYTEYGSVFDDVFKISHNLNVLPSDEVFSGPYLWKVDKQI